MAAAATGFVMKGAKMAFAAEVRTLSKPDPSKSYKGASLIRKLCTFFGTTAHFCNVVVKYEPAPLRFRQLLVNHHPQTPSKSVPE